MSLAVGLACGLAMKSDTLLKDDTLKEIKCRFGCEAPVVIIHVPNGCICWPDPVQALCSQHLVTAESTGPINILLDMRPPENRS